MKLNLLSFTCLLFFAFSSNSQNIQTFDQQEEKVQFIENKGQIHDQNGQPRKDVLFTGSTDGMLFQLKNDGVSYLQKRVDSWNEIGGERTPEDGTLYRTDVQWLNANKEAIIERGEALPGVSNYYLSSCPEGVLGVKSYESVTYKQIYTGIDLHWYSDGNVPEFDFIVQPGADYSQIRWKINGAESLEINDEGHLVIRTPLGEIHQEAPKTFQNDKLIESHWRLEDDIISFELSDYDQQLALVIDPILRNWGSYYGGNGDDDPFAVKIDGNNMYFAGRTLSTNSIATTGAHQTAQGGGTFKYDAYLVKFTTEGVRQWATYYGGNDQEEARDITFDNSGNVYMAGYARTDSGIATVGSHQATMSGTYDAMLVKFNSSGVRQWATYYGGTGIEQAYGCAFDGTNIYLTGYTTSSASIATAGTHQTSFGGNYDAFIAKFNQSGTRLWGTYYGGTSYEQYTRCAVDNSGNIYIAGLTASTTGISSTGAHQTTYGGGNEAFLAKFNTSGSRVWATYYGGTLNENEMDVAVDTLDNVYLSGQTNSTNNISTTGAHQTTLGGSWDGYLVKFNSSGTRQWGTYYGGTGVDRTYACKTDDENNVYFTGYTRSSSGIATPDGYDTSITTTTINYTMFVKMDANGNRIWGSYYGGGSNDRGYEMDVDGNSIYIVGNTNSGTGMTTAGAHQTTIGSPADAFLVRFTDCQNDSTNISRVACDSYLSPAGNTYTSTGIYIDTLTNAIGCDSVITIDLTINVTPTITSTTPGSRCGTGTVSVGATADAGTLFWYTGPTGGFAFDTGTVVLTPSITTTTPVYVEGNNAGCISSRTAVTATVISIPSISSITPGDVCDSGTVTLSATATSGVINWYATGSGGTSLGSGNSFTTPGITSSTAYYIDATDSGCTTASRTGVVATVKNSPIITSVTGGSTCGDGTVGLSATTSAGTINWYSSSTGGSSLGTGTTFTTPTIIGSTLFYVDATFNGCTSSPRTAVLASYNYIPFFTNIVEDSVCDSGSVTLSALTNAGIILWYTVPGGGTPIDTGLTYNFPSLTSSTTLYIGANNNGCLTESRSPITAKVHQTPSLLGSFADSTCGPDSTTLIALFTVGSTQYTTEWYSSSTGGVPLSTGTLYEPFVSSTTIFYATADNGGCAPAREPITAFVKTQPTITSTIPGNTCGPGSATLGATSSAGTVRWYTVPTLGSVTGTGSTYSTPTIFSNTTYYAEGFANGCESASRTPILATVTSIPSITSGTSGERCGPGTLSISATPSAGYVRWYSAATGGTLLDSGNTFTTPSLSSTTSYYPEAVDNGCVAMSRPTVFATIKTIPTVSSTTPADRCGNGPLTLSASPSAGLIGWYANATGGPVLGLSTSYNTPTLSSTSTYYVEAINNGCTTATRSPVIATVKPIPAVTSTVNDSVCDSGTMTLSATPSLGTVHWYNSSSGGSSIATGNNFLTPSLSVTSSYYADAIANGCTTSTRTEVEAIVHSTPTFTSTNSASRCGPGIVTVSAVPNFGNVTWYSASSGGSLLGSGSSYITPSISSTTSYFAEASSNGCSTSRVSATAVINFAPTIDSTIGASICDSGSVTLQAFSPGNTVNWYSTSTGGSSLGTGGSFNLSNLLTTSTFYAEASDTACFSVRYPVVATVNTTPNLTSTSNGSVCDSGTVLLSATASISAPRWYSVASGGAILALGNSFTTPPITSNTTFYVEASSNGCTSPRSAVDAIVNTTPSITSSTPGNICDSGSISLSATASAGLLEWFNVALGGTALGSGGTFNTGGITSTSNYYVQSTDSGCTSPRTMVVATVFTTPSITNTVPASVCDQGSVTLSASSNFGQIEWYDMLSGGTLLNIGQNYTTPVISSTTSYYLQAVDTVCISSRVMIDAEVLNSSSSNITEVACFEYVSPSGFYTYNQTGTYLDTISNSVGCDSVITIDLTVNDVDTSVTSDGRLITAVASGATYQWIDCTTGQPISGETDQTFSPQSNGSYAVVVTENNCSDTSECIEINTVGISLNHALVTRIYPNPSTQVFNIELDKRYDKVEFEVLNDVGQLILSEEHFDVSKSSIDLGNYSNGIYRLQIKTDESLIVKTLVKR